MSGVTGLLQKVFRPFIEREAISLELGIKAMYFFEGPNLKPVVPVVQPAVGYPMVITLEFLAQAIKVYSAALAVFSLVITKTLRLIKWCESTDKTV